MKPIILDEGACPVGISGLLWHFCQKLADRLSFTLRITSFVEGKHGDTSLHPKGYAVDFGYAGLNERQRAELSMECRELAERWTMGVVQVIEHDTHAHVEIDPFATAL